MNFSIFSLILILSSHSACQAKEWEPHPHQGLSKPYPAGKPAANIDSKEETQLRDGKLLQQSLKSGGGAGRALAIQDLHAPPEYVWDRILDFQNYPKMVPKVVKCRNYEIQTFRNGTEAIKTNMVMSVFGVKFDNFIYHTYFRSLSSLTWTLDYSRKSTLDDSVGYWYVEGAPGRSQEEAGEWSRVYYSCMLRVPKWVPGIVVSFLEKKAVSEANVWLKREAEAKFKNHKETGETLALKGGFKGFMLPKEGIDRKMLSLAKSFGKESAQVVEEPEEDEEGQSPGKLKIASRILTFGAGYSLGWLACSKKFASNESPGA
eukprot:CAMPEP_0171474022 /NCGR_PEP_ID=MMETSP0946-20130122/2187_1 /TAXON_ID=109269 /ORGANISM="Vaucheria litorea, Strain CCMP2940" /LENGTH=317 /DNA_ID=CAMNT_0012003893 /DNA_START=15 /DNA_END=968 /DNA_ORIENTATION=-